MTSWTSDFPRLTGIPFFTWYFYICICISSYCVLGCREHFSQREDEEENVRRLWSITTASPRISHVLKCHVTWYMLDNHYYLITWTIITKLTFAKDDFLIPSIKYFHAWPFLIIILHAKLKYCEWSLSFHDLHTQAQSKEHHF